MIVNVHKPPANEAVIDCPIFVVHYKRVLEMFVGLGAPHLGELGWRKTVNELSLNARS